MQLLRCVPSMTTVGTFNAIFILFKQKNLGRDVIFLIARVGWSWVFVLKDRFLKHFEALTMLNDLCRLEFATKWRSAEISRSPTMLWKCMDRKLSIFSHSFVILSQFQSKFYTYNSRYNFKILILYFYTSNKRSAHWNSVLLGFWFFGYFKFAHIT